ncbi:ROK family protein [bacterium]|nr:ROK family protein [bacterium]
METIGIDVGGQTIKGGIVTKNGEILSTYKLKTPTESAEKVLEAIVEVVKKLQNSQNFSVGIACPGMLDKTSENIILAPNIAGWKNYPLAENLKNLLPNTEISLINDANAAAFGEFIFGKGKGSKTLLVVTLGTGVGGGMVLCGKLFTGSFGAGVEIGHVSINLNGKKCNCGGTGCAEAYLGAFYLASEVSEKLKKFPNSSLAKINEPINFHHLTEAVLQKDKLATKIWNEKTKILGQFLASINNLMDFDKIVLAGGIAQAKDLLLEPVKKHFDEFSPFKRQTEILLTDFASEAGILGASAFSLIKN